jgi:NADPH:quinone reductase-like Zn-dependent oxidoreductase
VDEHLPAAGPCRPRQVLSPDPCRRCWSGCARLPSGKGDWLTVQGLPYVARLRYGLPNPKHPVPGFDVAGRIEAVGANVTQLQPGDAVFGWCDGSFAEYASVPQGQLARKPPNLSFEQAAAVPISGFAALQALRDTGGVQPGQQVRIIGASGGWAASRSSWPRRSAPR